MKLTKTILASLALCATTIAHAEVEWSGFGSLYYTQAFDSKFLPARSKSNKMDFTAASSLGLNMATRLSNELTASAQFIASGSNAQTENFNMFAQWAYLQYRMDNNVSFKLGRQLWPILIASEYQRVHHLLPSASIPGTAYVVLPFVSFDGASANYSHDLGFAKLTVGAYVGTPKLNLTPPAALNLEFQNLVGARVGLDGSGWKVHGTINHYYGKVAITIPTTGTTAIGAPGVVGTTFRAETHNVAKSFGIKFDKYNVVALLEGTHLHNTDTSIFGLTSKQLFETSHSAYALLGYRVGKFLPYLSAAQGYVKYGLPYDSTTLSRYEGRVTSYILGTAYHYNEQASIKLEYQRDTVPAVDGGFYASYIAQGYTKKYGDMISLGVDFIF